VTKRGKLQLPRLRRGRRGPGKRCVTFAKSISLKVRRKNTGNHASQNTIPFPKLLPRFAQRKSAQRPLSLSRACLQGKNEIFKSTKNESWMPRNNAEIKLVDRSLPTYGRRAMELFARRLKLANASVHACGARFERLSVQRPASHPASRRCSRM
jgi:hypothetical protein